MLLTDWLRFLSASRSQICAHRRVSGSRRKRARANGAADISSQTESLEQRMMLSAADILLTDVSGATGFQVNVTFGDQLGNSIRAAGDVNGDGFDDVIIGDYYENNGPAGTGYSGIAYVLFGKSSGFPNTNGSDDALWIDLNNPLSATEGFKILGVDGSDTGTAVSGAGDINGDGFDDLVIAAPSYSLQTPIPGEYSVASSYVVFGKANNTDINLSSIDAAASDTVGFKLTGFFGTREKNSDSVATGGDINGDGYDDIVFGGPLSNVDALTHVGAAYVVFGKENGFSNLDISDINGSNGFVFANTSDYSSTSAHIGAAVSIGGDINGDGFDDLVVGAPQMGIERAANRYVGEVYVVFGRSDFGGILNASHQVQASTLDGSNGFLATGLPGQPARTGHSISSGGDINGDGIDDFVVGAPGDGYYPAELTDGRAYVVFGKTNLGSGGTLNLETLSGSNGFILDDGTAFDLAGSSVSITGDINGDGFDDVVVGAPSYNLAPANEYNNGAAYVIFGDTNINVPSDLDALNGVNGFALFGRGSGYAGKTVAIAGDINGDGFDDLLVAEPSNGVVTFFFGKDFGLRDGSGANGELNPSSPSIRQVNGSADGTLTAGQGTAADILIGGGGDDTLTSDGGSDILIGGEGDDVLTAVFGNFAGGAVVPRFDGGTGVDTLTGEISFVNQTIDLTTVPGNRINDIEVIDLEDSATETLVLDFATVLAITGAGPTTASSSVFATNDAHTLVVLRDPEDVINGIADGANGWTQGSNETIDGNTFEVFTQFGATVKIQAPVNITGNIDGDSDFDSNDSFMINIVLLGASDSLINSSKGASPLTAQEIRDNITALQASGQLDVDGDGDSESNDSFLTNIIKLGASDGTIDSSKGASPLTATQIRANVTALTPPAARPQSPLQTPSDEPQEEKPEFAAFVLPPPANPKQTQTSQTPSGDSQDEEEESEFAAFVLSPPDNQEETLTSDGSGSPETTQQSESQPVSTENDTIPDEAFEAVQLDVTLDLLT